MSIETVFDSPKVIYGRDVEPISQDLKSDLDKGLSSQEAAQRLETYGLNKLVEAEKNSPLKVLLLQFANPLLIILLVGAGISAYTSH